ncbi:Vps74p [Sugiyamaella lignohabitans]|uniref:Vacuolar protein sorting-associated protein 74 n=1 Tax=Sugiyamaella lignohabitans TaxID=796027 RepID=A0A167ENM8_9ASCO|nr:Vps74p [Sugiyamaella lignohabitans]ANB14286.1 Vps74p [Sugiyamaella lignohabitans]
MSSGGLQRRRVAGGGSSGATSQGSNNESSPNNSQFNGSGGSRHGSASPAVGSSEDRKVAYDPQDINNTADELRQPKFTLMEEVLLMGLKDRQGYLSFWNDNISYALRGCILMELAFRGKIAMVNDPVRRRLPLSDRYVEVIDDKITGEALLDETIKIMKTSEPLSIGTWIDYLSGETWNLTKISFQLKQVRERLAKGLVDKGVLRTEKRNFFLFDMATHPVTDTQVKDEIKRRVITLLTARTCVLGPTPYFPEDVPFRYLRSIALVGGSYAANVLENALSTLGYDARDNAFARADEILGDYSEWPFISRSASEHSTGVGVNLSTVIADEVAAYPDKALQIEIIAAVFSVYAKLDAIM